MTSPLKFDFCEGGEIQASWSGGVREIAGLSDLRVVFGVYEQYDDEGLSRVGLIAALLCRRNLDRAGMEVGESTIMRTLDQYDFILNDDRCQEMFCRGLQQGVEMIREDSLSFEMRISRVLE